MLGKAGAGKSLLTMKLFEKKLLNWKLNDYIPLRLNLPNVIKIKEFVVNILKITNLKQEFFENNKFLIILDSYDEIN